MKTKIMMKTRNKKPLLSKMLSVVFVALHVTACFGQVKENAAVKQNTTFPQIHSNLNGMVREFVRTMHQDTKGNFWFGTNGNGIIRYDGQTLETMTIEGTHPNMRVIEIVEDKKGNLWFGTSDGLVKYDGRKWARFSKKEGLPGRDEEIWGLLVDKDGIVWVGASGGVCHFDGERFIPFSLPDSTVENRQYMLSDKLVFKIIEDKHGNIWLATDGNGIFKYHNGAFTHLTTKNGLPDNNTADILEDKQGNIWISTFYGGTSKFDGTRFTNFTQDGLIKGLETGGLYADSKGNVWFTAENVGVYKYDGANFILYTKEDGLTSNVVLSIFEDNKGQLWFGTWQGICIYDGAKFMNASEKEPWVK
jgi:ligand-binding sensor domain-containing protein